MLFFKRITYLRVERVTIATSKYLSSSISLSIINSIV
jgi:hypothetical protein